MEKSYYAYCRPKLPNHPWSLERIPFNKSILSISKNGVDIKGGKNLPFDTKELDEIGVSLGSDGSLLLPVGRYVIEFHSVSEIPVAGNIVFSLDDHIISYLAEASTPLTMMGRMIYEVTEDNKPIKLTNKIKDTVKVSDVNLIINKI